MSWECVEMDDLSKTQEINKTIYCNYVLLKNGINYVRPINVSKTFSILCPYCFEIHHHGIKYGHRVSHCKKIIKNSGYVIVPNFEDKTIRKYEQLMRKHYE